MTVLRESMPGIGVSGRYTPGAKAAAWAPCSGMAEQEAPRDRRQPQQAPAGRRASTSRPDRAKHAAPVNPALPAVHSRSNPRIRPHDSIAAMPRDSRRSAAFGFQHGRRDRWSVVAPGIDMRPLHSIHPSTTADPAASRESCRAGSWPAIHTVIQTWTCRRKLPSSSRPYSVRIDSGWNCTPQTGRLT